MWVAKSSAWYVNSLFENAKFGFEWVFFSQKFFKKKIQSNLAYSRNFKEKLAILVKILTKIRLIGMNVSRFLGELACVGSLLNSQY